LKEKKNETMKAGETLKSLSLSNLDLDKEKMRKRKRQTLRPGFDSPSATRAKWLPLEEAALALSFAGREGGKERERE
jgi:hypothetical protein